jgi:chorismate synthase
VVSSWGTHLKMTIFGESHGPKIGAVVDGLPPGEKVDLAEIQAFLQRRAPGNFPWSTTRREADTFTIVSGVYRGRTTGTPLCVLMDNTDARPQDYAEQKRLPRPSHADYTGRIRYQGANDPRGGGHFSGRLTAPLCAVGAVCRQILSRRGITIAARIAQIGEVCDEPVDLARPDLEKLHSLEHRQFPVLGHSQGREMIAVMEAARAEGDSVGGIVQAFVLGVPPGLGDPIFGGVESRLASLLYGIPAVKGVSFGAGFDVCTLKGSENNDSFYLEEGQVRTCTNNDGGLNGGITNGMPVVVNVGIKPTPSIALPQQSVDLETLSEETLVITGRHDPCIVPRALVAVEAGLAAAFLDLYLGTFGLKG